MIAKNDTRPTIVEVRIEVIVKPEHGLSLGTNIELSDGTMLTHEMPDEQLMAAIEGMSEDSRNSPEMTFAFRMRDLLQQLIPTLAASVGLPVELVEEEEAD